MSSVTLTWNEFLKETQEFLQISEHLGDNWILYKKNDMEGNTFLIYKQKLSLPSMPIAATTEEEELTDNLELPKQDNAIIPYVDALSDLLQIEYHIVYSIAYQVPVLYFVAHKNDGRPISLDDAWKLLRSNMDSSSGQNTREDLLKILTQMEHPVLFRPYLALHPCRTADLLGQAGKSQNRILTFISIMGPYVQLNLSNEYGLDFN